MKRISKIILAGAAIAVIGGFGARDVLANHAEPDRDRRHYEQSGERDRHVDRNRAGDRGERHVNNRHERRNYGRHDRRGNYGRNYGGDYGWGRQASAHHGWRHRTNHYARHGYGRPYARHINAAYRHGAMHCRPVSRVGHVRGHRALLGGVMCLDRHGIAFVIPQTRHVIHTY